MSCPFLRRWQARGCRNAPLSRFIVRQSLHAVSEKCTSAQYAECGLYRENPEPDASPDCCPYFEERTVETCMGAPNVRFSLPQGSLPGRCHSEQYKYCDVYLSLAHQDEQTGVARVEDIPVPSHLAFTRNHLWIDESADNTWHMGIDAFLARVLGRVDEIRFGAMTGYRRPAVTLTVRGADLRLVFPAAMSITASHAYLRVRPETLTADPYGQGWLFEGDGTHRAHVLRGEAAVEWMRGEAERLSSYVHSHLARLEPELAADGGMFGHDLAGFLGRDELLALFDDFFWPEIGQEDNA